MTRVIAIDWSGAKSGASSKIWLAEVYDGRLVRLESGRNRGQLVAHLIRDASADNDVVVGLDFAFSFPQLVCKAIGCDDDRGAVASRCPGGRRMAKQLPTPFLGEGREAKAEPARTL